MRLSYLLALALSLPAPALAQDQVPSESEILVVGNRQQEKERREQVRDFVRALTTEPSNSPMTRFDTACPGVAGLSEAQNRAIATRMRHVAEAAKIPLAEDGCRPNILVIVVPDKDDMLEALRKKHLILFRNGDNKPVEIAREEGPVTAWHVTVPVDRNGQGLISMGGPVTISFDGASPRVLSLFRPVAIGAIVLIEQKGLIGLTTTQIADYAAMRAFTTMRVERLAGSNASTILHLMDSKLGDPTPLSLTQWDLSFLKSAYAVPPYAYVGSQRSRIRKAINKELEQAEAGE